MTEAATPDWIPLLGPSVAFCGAIAAATLAWISLKTNASVNLRNKRADVIMNCNARYSELAKIKSDIVDNCSALGDEEYTEEIKAKAKDYFRKYWYLKSDQLDYWFAGYIDPENLATWLMSSCKDFSAINPNVICEKRIYPKIGGMTYAEGWKYSRPDHIAINQRLVEIVYFIEKYMKRIKSNEDRYISLIHYLRILENFEYRQISILSRTSNRRLYAKDLSLTLRSDYRKKYLSFVKFGIRRKYLFRFNLIKIKLIYKSSVWVMGKKGTRFKDLFQSVGDLLSQDECCKCEECSKTVQLLSEPLPLAGA